MTRVERTIVIEGDDEWVDRTLENALLRPDRPVYECHYGTITETSRTGGEVVTDHASTAITEWPVHLRHLGRTRAVRIDRPLWRRIATAIFGCCHHVTHPQFECQATWQRVWKSGSPSADVDS